MKYIQQSFDQTGVAVFIMEGGKEKVVPTFSLNPEQEIKELFYYIEGVKELKNIYYTNNMMDYKIEDTIEGFVNEYGCLPGDLMDELLSGFPYITGDTMYTLCFYK